MFTLFNLTERITYLAATSESDLWSRKVQSMLIFHYCLFTKSKIAIETKYNSSNCQLTGQPVGDFCCKTVALSYTLYHNRAFFIIEARNTNPTNLCKSVSPFLPPNCITITK